MDFDLAEESQGKGPGRKSKNITKLKNRRVTRKWNPPSSKNDKVTLHKLASSLKDVKNDSDLEVWYEKVLIRMSVVALESSPFFNTLCAKLPEKTSNPYFKNIKNYELILEVYRRCKKEPWFKPTQEMYHRLCAVMGWCRKPDLAYDAIVEMQSEGIPLTTSSCNYLIRALINSKCYDEASEILRRMSLSKTCPPDVKTYNIFIEATCSHGNPASAIPYLEKIQGIERGGNDHTVACLLEGFCLLGNYEAVGLVFDEVFERKLLVKAKVMAIVVLFLGKQKDAERLKKAWTLCNIPPYSFTPRLLSIFLWGFAQCNQMDELLAAMKTFNDGGLKYRLGSYMSIFGAFSDSKNPMKYKSEILELWDRFSKDSITVPPGDSQFYNSLARVYGAAMSSLYKVGAYDVMTEAFHRCLEFGCPPLPLTCGTLIRGYAHGGYIEEMELSFEMLRQVTSLNSDVQADMIAAYEKVGDDLKAELLRLSNNWFTMKEADSSTELEDDDVATNDEEESGTASDDNESDNEFDDDVIKKGKVALRA